MKINLLQDAIHIKQLKDIKKTNEKLDELKNNYTESNKEKAQILQELRSRFDELKAQLDEIMSYKRLETETRKLEIAELTTIWNTRLDE